MTALSLHVTRTLQAAVGEPAPVSAPRTSVSPNHALPPGLALIVIALLPWMLMSVSPHWIYTDMGYIDPWLYHGYFHRYPEFVSRLYPGTYYGTRLAWILPGYAAYQLFAPHTANLVLHLGFYYVALAALYRTGTLLGSAPAALLASVAFGTSMPVLAALGMDYVDGAVITYALVGIWAVVEASRSARRGLLLTTAGAAAACVVHSNLGAVFLCPTIVVAYWFSHARKHWSDPLLFIAGGVLLTAALGLVNVLAGGPFLFFMSSVRWATASLGTQPFIPVPPLKWPGSARFVVPLIGVAAAAGAFLARRTPETRVGFFILACLVAIFIGYDWTFSAALLQTQYYVSWFLPLAFLGLAVALGPIRLTPVVTIGLCVAVAALQASALDGVPASIRAALFARYGTRLPAIEISIAALAFAVTLVMSARPRAWWQAVVVMSCTVIAGFVATPNLGYGPGRMGPREFEGVQQTLTFIRNHIPNDHRVLFWMQSGANGQYYVPLASTHLFAYSLIGTDYPKLPVDRATAGRTGTLAAPGEYVVVVSDNEVDPAAVSREFERFQLEASVLAAQALNIEGTRFVLTLLRTSGPR